MTRFAKIYGKLRNRENVREKPENVNSMNREGYGYIKRRVGLLSNEVEGPTYLSISELSNYIKNYITKD